MKVEVIADLPAVPEVVLECFFIHPSNQAMTRIRVEGYRNELESLLFEFTRQVRDHQHDNKYGYEIPT